MMKVKIRYANGRLDIFDTDTFTKSEPFAGTSMLTNFELRLDRLGNSGLWLEAHHYDTSPSAMEQADDTETPTAKRKRGWRFLLAEKGEMDGIECVLLDETCILQRICGELVDVMRLTDQCSAWVTSSQGLCVAEKILELYPRIATTSETGDAHEIARSCGCSFSLVKELQELFPRDSEKAKDADSQGADLEREIEADNFDEEKSWLEGFDDEDAY